MTEKPLENQPHIENQPLPNEGADFLEFQQWKAQKEQEQRDADRKHFSQQADDQHAQEVKAKILEFPQKAKALSVVESKPLSLDPKDEEDLRKNPTQWLNDRIGPKQKKVAEDPYTAVESLALGMEIEQKKREDLKKAA